MWNWLIVGTTINHKMAYFTWFFVPYISPVEHNLALFGRCCSYVDVVPHLPKTGRIFIYKEVLPIEGQHLIEPPNGKRLLRVDATRRQRQLSGKLNKLGIRIFRWV